jgi:hypothetical protein
VRYTPVCFDSAVNPARRTRSELVSVSTRLGGQEPLLTEKYRYVRRHDVPHVRELAGLIDLLWQEIEIDGAKVPEVSPLAEIGTY